MPGSRPIARSRRLRRAGIGRGSTLNDLDALPEAKSPADLFHLGSRRLVAPGRPVVPLAGDDHVIELDAVRAGAVVRGLGCLFEPIKPYRFGGKVLISFAFNDVIAVGDHGAVYYRLHRICSSNDALWCPFALYMFSLFQHAECVGDKKKSWREQISLSKTNFTPTATLLDKV